jgi:hypothetical protein
METFREVCDTPSISLAATAGPQVSTAYIGLKSLERLSAQLSILWAGAVAYFLKTIETVKNTE